MAHDSAHKTKGKNFMEDEPKWEKVDYNPGHEKPIPVVLRYPKEEYTKGNVLIYPYTDSTWSMTVKLDVSQWGEKWNVGTSLPHGRAARPYWLSQSEVDRLVF